MPHSTMGWAAPARWRVALVALGLAAACSPSVSSPVGDGDVDTDADGDTDADEACVLAELGEECAAQSDCCPGLVCFSPEGDSRPSICTEWCEGDECPEGYGCRVFNDGTGGETRVCWYPENTLCNSCEENVECGEVRDLCIEMPDGSGDLFCSIYCDPVDPDSCPDGFTCTAMEREIPTHQCMPDDGICCVDEDHDRFGRGDACAGTDCNDRDALINPDAADECDGVDYFTMFGACL